MQNLISYLQRKGYRIETYGTGNTKPLLRWGEIYYSDVNDKRIYLSFYFYFKDTPVKITKYKIQTATNQPLPTKWTLSVSYDNHSYEIISDITDNDFCPKSNQVNPEGYYILCNDQLTKSYSAKTNFEHAKYYKFDMKKNSYDNNSNWPYLLTIMGFEIDGSFLVEYKGNIKCSNYIILRDFITFIPICFFLSP